MRQTAVLLLAISVCVAASLQTAPLPTLPPGSSISYEVFSRPPDTAPTVKIRDTLNPPQRRDSAIERTEAVTSTSTTGVLEFAGSTDWLGPMDMCVLDSHLYLTANLGIRVWDLRNPAQPRFVRQYDWPTPSGAVREIKGENGFLYLLTPTQGIQIFDASNPANLQPRGSLALAVLLNFMEVSNGILYIPSAYDYLFVVDATIPDHPYIQTQFRSWDIDFASTQGMALYFVYSTPILYFSTEWANTPLYTYNMVDPNYPWLANTYWGAAAGKPPFGGKLKRYGNYLYAKDNLAPFLKIMDLTNPYSPQYACSVDVSVPISDYAVEGNRLYVTSTAGIRTYDIASPCSPTLEAIALLDGFTDGATGNILACDNWVYNQGWDNGFRLKVGASDMSVPSEPATQILYSAKVPSQLSLSETAPVGASATWGGLISARIFDLSAPFAPKVGSDIGPGNDANHQTGADLDGTLMYVCSDDITSPPHVSGISLFDVSDPRAAFKLSQREFGRRGDEASRMSFRDVAAANRYAYVAAEDSGLFIFHYPQLNTNPALVFKLAVPPQAQSIAIKGNRAYVVCWGQLLEGWYYEGSYLVVVDISNPTSPQIVGYQEPWGHYNVDISGSRLATTSWLGTNWGVTIYQIDSTGWPVVVGTYAPDVELGEIRLLEVTSNYLYVKNGNKLDVVDISDPAAPVLAERYTPLGQLYDVAVKGEAVYIGQESGLRIYRGPACCEGTAGNVDGLSGVDISDLSRLISYLVASGSLICYGEADINQSGGVDLSDMSILIYYMTGGAYQLPACQ